MTDTVTSEQGKKVECEEKEEVTVAEANRMTTSRRTGKRGRKPAKVDVKAKLERSRQSARECRARKKLRYQYLEELVTSREKAIYALRKELEMCKQWCMSLDKGKLPADICETLEMERKRGLFTEDETRIPRTKDWCELTLDSSDDESADTESLLGSETVSEMVELNKVTPKVKGKGKTTSKQILNVDNTNTDMIQMAREEPPSLPNSDLSVKGSTSQMKSDTGAHMVDADTPVLDGPVGASRETFLPNEVSNIDHANLGTDQSKCHLPSSGANFQTINQLDLLLSTANSVDAAPSLIGSLNSEDQLQCLGALSETDINDVLEVIEKESCM